MMRRPEFHAAFDPQNQRRATLVAVLGAAVAGAATSIPKVSAQSAVATLNDGSAAEQAFIFSGLPQGRT
jgi:hypothetical protein